MTNLQLSIYNSEFCLEAPCNCQFSVFRPRRINLGRGVSLQFSIYGDSSPPSIRQRQYKKELETADKATVNKILDSIEGAKKSLVKLSNNYQAIQSEIVKLRENQCSIYKRAAALEEQGKTDCVKPIADLASKPLRPAN